MRREEIFVRLLATLGHTFNHGARRVRKLYDWLPGSGRALRRSEKELRDVMPATLWRTSPDGSVDFINQNWVQATGLPSEAAFGMELANRGSSRRPPQVHRRVEQSYEGSAADEK